MSIEVFTLGGYEEVGKNMTAVKIDEQVVILDMGISLDRLVQWEEAGNEMNDQAYAQSGALPDDSILDKYKDKVAAIIISHGHLDHSAAVGKLAKKYNAPVVGTPYTMGVINNVLSDEKNKKNIPQLVTMNAGEVMELGDISVEFVHSTHSIPQTIFPVIHTSEGAVFYAVDYKFDHHQELAPLPDYKRIRKIGKQGVKGIIAEAVRVRDPTRTPSEAVAKQMLSDIVEDTYNEKSGIVIASFASHIERLNSIEKIANKMGRRLIFAGSSMEKYTQIAKDIGLKEFKDVEIAGRPRARKKSLEKAAKNKSDYMLVVTGGQAEPNSVLGRINNNEYAYRIEKGDEVVFSCITIPTKTNIANRAQLEASLTSAGARIFKDVHCSGHAAREDHREMLNMLSPEHVIPFHGDMAMLNSYAELCFEMSPDAKIGRNVHLMRNGDHVTL